MAADDLSDHQHFHDKARIREETYRELADIELSDIKSFYGEEHDEL